MASIPYCQLEIEINLTRLRGLRLWCAYWIEWLPGWIEINLTRLRGLRQFYRDQLLNRFYLNWNKLDPFEGIETFDCWVFNFKVNIWIEINLTRLRGLRHIFFCCIGVVKRYWNKLDPFEGIETYDTKQSLGFNFSNWNKLDPFEGIETKKLSQFCYCVNNIEINLTRLRGLRPLSWRRS